MFAHLPRPLNVLPASCRQDLRDVGHASGGAPVFNRLWTVPSGQAGWKPALHLRSRGYTLIEVVGVLAIMAILAAVVLESILEKMKQANRDAEAQTLTNIVASLSQNIVRTKGIAAVSNWSQAIGSELSLPAGQVATAKGGNTRLFWVDPNCSLTVPYTQASAGLTSAPVNARVLVVSSLAGPLPTLTLDAANFSNIWNTPPKGVPAGWSADWAKASQDLKIQRTDLGSLFHRVILENLDLTQAPYAIENNALTYLTPQQRRELWVMKTTALNLSFYPNYSTTNTIQVQAREAVKEDISFVFEHGRWARYVYYGRASSFGWFGQMVDQFLKAPPPPGMTRRYSNQQWIIDAMYTYLYCFGEWSLDNFTGGPPWPHIPGYEQASAGATGLQNYSSDLIIYY